MQKCLGIAKHVWFNFVDLCHYYSFDYMSIVCSTHLRLKLYNVESQFYYTDDSLVIYNL